MNIDDLQKKLLAAARTQVPSDAVPYAFEKRIMAHLSMAAAPADIWNLWGNALWKAAAPCIAITLALGIWAAMGTGSGADELLLTELENTVMAPLQHPEALLW